MFTSLFLMLLVWGIFRRIRRIVGRRPYEPAKIRFRLLILGIMMGLIFFMHPFKKETILFGVIGVILGALLVFIMSKSTKFHVLDGTVYYEVNSYLSMLIVVLILTRIVMKLPLILYLTAWLDAKDKPVLDLELMNKVIDPYSFLLIIMMFAYFIGSTCWIYYKGKSVMG